ncbi:MAG: S8 family serine peptidase [Clostridium sp.]|nr:S8 family serine peptidase [Clostridium sp.]
MKKIISIILSVVLALAVFTPLYTAIHDEAERESVEHFCSAVTQLSKKYDKNISCTAYSEEDHTAIDTALNRLIVKTNDKINDTDAIDSVYGLDYSILQYKNQGDMQKAYKKLKSLGYTVAEDNIISVWDNEIESPQLSQKNNTFAFAGNSESAYSYCQANYAMQKYKDCKEEIVVGIMDTGIDYNHNEFQGRYVHNPVNFGTSGEPDDPMDDQMHGTACASIVTQSTPDNVKVKPYKILNKNGSATELNVIAACEYILAEKDKPDIVNMSFGGYDKSDGFSLIVDLIDRLVENGITVSAAAGNEALPSDYAYPAGCDSVITVTSGYLEGTSSFSNYGDKVDITAPGENVTAAKLNGGYTSEYSGTSFSAPLASAACAYVLMQNPNATPDEVKEKLKSSAVDMGEEDRFYYGAGLLSFANLTLEDGLEAPVPNVVSGLYHEAQTIEFSNIPEGTNLVYTVYTLSNGVIDNQYNQVYTEPITIDCDAKLIYALMSDNDYVSPFTSQNYTIQYYAPSSDFTIVAGTIMKYKGDKTNIIVPDKIAALKPTALYKELFKDSKLTSIVLPDTVTTLGTGCFQGASKLRHIVAKGVTKLNGDSVFSDCSDLRDEAMPKLKTVTASAFKNCKRLHEIDFSENLTELKNELFSGAGLMHGNFPNAKNTAVSNVFKSCPLFTCNIPKFTALYTEFFYGCRLLYELHISPVTKIFASALHSCELLKELDTSQLVTLESGALSGCYIDTFYAPKCTVLPAKFGKYCHIRVIDLPNAKGEIGTELFNCATTEELYLDSVTSVSKSAFRNTINLNILYLPNTLQYYEPYTNVTMIDSLLSGDHWAEKPPLEIVWIPKAELPSSINCYGTKLLYAPAATSLTLNVNSAEAIPNIVVSDKIAQGGINVTNTEGSAVIIAPSNTYAQQYAKDENCNYTFVSTQEVCYSHLDDRNYFTYETGGSDFSVPYRFIASYWQNDVINKNRNAFFYGFLLDFEGDNILNAKDYSVLAKY